jgi:hypothetical protein
LSAVGAMIVRSRVTPGRYLGPMLSLLAPAPDATAATDLSVAVESMSDAELHALYLECRRRERVAAAEGAAALAEIDRRRSFLGEGYLSSSAFVAHRNGDSHRAAAGLVRMARALEAMPHTAGAFRAGDIDSIRVRRLIDARDASPEAFADDEEALVERACAQDATTFALTAGLWRENAASQLTRREEREQFERRRLSFSETFEGMVHLEALMDPVSAETVITAVGAVCGPAARGGSDGRTPAQRRVDALSEICRRYLDSGEGPIAGGQKPHLSVIVDVDGLAGGVVTRSEIGHGRSLGPAAREFLACDATVCGVVMDGTVEVLQMGRKVRTATPAQLRALAIRDGGCVIPGCGRPPSWCDAHHEIGWIHGGRTDVEKMRLVCRPHHLMIHLGVLDLPKRE